MYALYESYGFNKSDIGTLCILIVLSNITVTVIAGFLSSAVFGTFVGSLADK